MHPSLKLCNIFHYDVVWNYTSIAYGWYDRHRKISLNLIGHNMVAVRDGLKMEKASLESMMKDDSKDAEIIGT